MCVYDFLPILLSFQVEVIILRLELYSLKVIKPSLRLVIRMSLENNANIVTYPNSYSVELEEFSKKHCLPRFLFLVFD